MSPVIKKTLLFIFKLFVSSGLLYIVLSRTGIDKVLGFIRNINPWAFAFVVLIYVSAQLVSSFRWRLLLPEKFRIRRLFSLYLLGSFFNTFMPGLVGGDAVKIYYLYRETGKGMPALSSVFMDRYIGFTAMMIIALIAFPFGLKYIAGSWIQWILPAIVVMFAVSSLLVFGLRLGKRVEFLNNVYEYFHTYSRKREVVVKALVLSFVIQSLIVFCVYILSAGLGLDLPLHAFFIFIPIISALSALPVSISGLGIREASTVLLFGTVGVRPDMATALSFAWFLAVATGGLCGLYEYLRSKDYGKKA